MKAKAARPNGHHSMKAMTTMAITAGFGSPAARRSHSPNWVAQPVSAVPAVVPVAILISLTRHVNVNNINIEQRCLTVKNGGRFFCRFRRQAPDTARRGTAML
jgi:hypothetical protein